MNIIMKSGRTFSYEASYYLAGPMTGLPESNYPEFALAKLLLGEEKIQVKSPHEIDFMQHKFVRAYQGLCGRVLGKIQDLPVRVCKAVESDPIHNTEPGSLPYATYLKSGYKLLLECDGIILLHGWTKSRGVKHELYIARSLGYPVFVMGEGYLMELQSDEG